jgi:hypothetical protein
MKLKIVAALIALVLVASVFSLAFNPVMAGEGNNLPSGKHYTLNILGKKWDKGDAALEPPLLPDGSPNPDYNPVVKPDSGHRIFVKLGSPTGASTKTRIGLRQGDDFAVLDADGTDGKALFQLPDPGDVIDPITGEYDPDAADYLVFIKVLSPKGKAKMTTGVWTDPEGNIWVVSEEALYLNQPKPAGKEGKSINKGNQFEDVTKELTTILYDFDGDGTAERIEIFDPAYQYYFWDYDNNGLKHVQLRFYKLVDINKMPAA